MIHIVCTKCNLAMRTSGEPAELDGLIGERSEWYPNKYPCPGCGAAAEFVESISPHALRVLDMRDLSLQEVFAALNGLGLPEEQECGPMALRAALAQPVKNIDCDLARGTTRTVLRSLEMQDGTRIYFGASPYGALVYRIAKKRSYTEEVLSAQG